MTFVPTIPDSISGRVRHLDDGFHISTELRGSPDLDRLFADYTSGTGTLVIPVRWYDPIEFEQKFGIRYETHGIDLSADPSRWVENYIQNLLRRSVEKKVSDIHITYMGQYTTIQVRRMGLLMLDETRNGEEGLQIIRGMFQGSFSQAESGWTEYERYDGRIADHHFLPPGLFNVRLHSEPLQSPHIATPGVCVAMRLQYDATGASGSLENRLQSLGYAADQVHMVRKFIGRSGLTIISGPTGHGKTTVLKNVMEAQAEEFPTKNYWSLEDPPEYTITGVKQLNVPTKAGTEDERRKAIGDAIAGILRSDPDCLLIGEIRHRETAELAVIAAQTGHAVWSTVHANSAIGIINRLHELGMPHASICSDGVLNGLVYQRLMPVLCPHCSKRLADSKIDPDLMQRLKAVFPHGEIDAIRVKGNGCPHCDGLGVRGLQAAAELIDTDDQRLLALLRENRPFDAHRYWINEMGGTTHVQQALGLIAAGRLDPALAEERLGVLLDHDLRYGAPDLSCPPPDHGVQESLRQLAVHGTLPRS